MRRGCPPRGAAEHAPSGGCPRADNVRPMWLPPAPEPVDRSALEPWPVPGVTYEAELAYIVVDELHEGIAGLVMSPWPRVDDRGRLVFGGEQESTRVAAPAAALEALLSEQRTPVVEGGAADLAALQARAVQIGDVFAACVHGTPVSGAPATWMRPPVLDITAPARELAKAQTSAALSGAMSADYLDLVAEEFVARD